MSSTCNPDLRQCHEPRRHYEYAALSASWGAQTSGHTLLLGSCSGKIGGGGSIFRLIDVKDIGVRSELTLEDEDEQDLDDFHKPTTPRQWDTIQYVGGETRSDK